MIQTARALAMVLFPTLLLFGTACGGGAADPDGGTATDGGGTPTDGGGGSDGGPGDAGTEVPAPVLSEVGPQCTSYSGSFQWTEVPGASYWLEYGPITGPLQRVQVPEGVTSHQPSWALQEATYVVRVWAELAGRTSSIDEIFFEVAGSAVATASNDGPFCEGGTVTLLGQTVQDAVYAWTGPNGFSSSEQNPVLSAATAAVAGTYSLVVTVNGCVSAPATTLVEPASAQSFVQTTTADFAGNTNVDVETVDDEVKVRGPFAGGTGADGAYNPTVSTTLASGTYNFTSVNIPAGVTITVTGSQQLHLYSQGDVVIEGALRADGAPGTPGIIYSGAGLGGAGVAGGGTGGNGSFDPYTGPLAGNPGTGDGPGAGGAGWGGGGGAGHAAVGESSGGSGGAGGSSYGTPDLSVLTAGSGGGSGSGGNNCGSGGGGGGGGVVLLQAPLIRVGSAGLLSANGGSGGSDGTGHCGAGGGGSGGAILLRTVTLEDLGSISVAGGAGGASEIDYTPYWGGGGAGSAGYYQVEYLSADPVGDASGSTTTAEIAPARLCGWGQLQYSVTQSGAQTVMVDVLDASGAVLSAAVPSGTDLDTLPAVSSAASLRLRATLTSEAGVSPALTDWTLGYTGL